MITSTHGIVASQMTTFDANAWAFITAAGITNGAQRTAINNLVLSLKSANIWTKFTAIWPMVGGTSTTHGYNLVNPAQYFISFISTWSHSPTGATPTSVNSYANTNLNCSTVLTQSNNHMAFYSRSNTTGAARTSMGAYGDLSAGAPIYNLSLKNGLGNAGAFNTTQASGQAAIAANANSQGLYVGNKNGTAIGNLTLFKNGSQIAANTVAITTNNYPNLNLYIGASSTQSGTGFFQVDDKECAFASVGTRFTSGEMSTFYTIVQAYQTTLSRQV